MKARAIFVNVLIDEDHIWKNKIFPGLSQYEFIHHYLVYFVRVYLCKQWQELISFNDHTAMATGVRFGHNATFVASGSMDRSVKFFGIQ